MLGNEAVVMLAAVDRSMAREIVVLAVDCDMAWSLGL